MCVKKKASQPFSSAARLTCGGDTARFLHKAVKIVVQCGSILAVVEPKGRRDVIHGFPEGRKLVARVMFSRKITYLRLQIDIGAMRFVESDARRNDVEI